MTLQEAKILLRLDDEFTLEKVIEAQENLVFEFKNFFLTKVPVQKLFQSRLDKLEKLDLISDFFSIEKLKFVSEFWAFEFESDLVLEVFQKYQIENKRIKSKIAFSDHPSEIFFWVNLLLQLEKKYAHLWFSEMCLEEEIQVSKEIDPMILLQEIKKYDGKTFDSLKKGENNPSEILIKEMKRLSLLAHKY